MPIPRPLRILKFMLASLDSSCLPLRKRVSESRKKCGLRGWSEKPRTYTSRFPRTASATQHDAGLAVIAEVKKASPSKGLIRADFRPNELARELELGGRRCALRANRRRVFSRLAEYLEDASAATSIPLPAQTSSSTNFKLSKRRAIVRMHSC